jgi:hypothetical protein
MPEEIGIVDLLQLFGFDAKCRSKLVRHQDKRWDMHDLLRRDWFDAYQSFQLKPRFDNLDYIISFVGVGGTRARLAGIFKVVGRQPGGMGILPSGCPHIEWKDIPYFYELERQAGFEALEHRVVIEWGRGALAWHQYTTNKIVTEVLPKGHRLRLFTDYLNFTLTHAELRYLYVDPEANREWRARLSAVAGIYLILDTITGQQYVGSAYGTDGIWGRWAAYAANGHGGNRLLEELVAKSDTYPDAFSYSVLQVLPKTVVSTETLEWECLYKEKLGSRAMGLNAN